MANRKLRVSEWARPAVKIVAITTVLGFSFLPALAKRWSSRSTDAWITGDWLIDYSSGFIRRGLAGEAIAVIAQWGDSSRFMVLFSLQVILFVSLFASVIYLYWTHTSLYISTLLFLSPAFLLFYTDPNGAFRKELLLFAAVSSALAVTKAVPRTARMSPAVLIAGLPILVLVHEGLFFWTPMVLIICLRLMQESEWSKKGQVVWLVFGGLVALIAFLASYLHQGSANTGAHLCENLIKEGFETSICEGSLEWLGVELAEMFIFLQGNIFDEGYISTYALSAFLSVLPLLFIQLGRNWGAALFLATLVPLPLFFVTIDWGRWVALSFSLLYLFALRFSGPQSDEQLPIAKAPRTLAGGGLLLVLSLLWVSTWSIPICCGDGSVGPGLVGRLIGLVG